MPKPIPLVRAEWCNLLFLNYAVDAALLEPYLPAGTELDLWEGRPLMSVVGLLFRDTRVVSVPVPFHRRFAQVNLRFYVRSTEGDVPRAGVVFIKEIVPRFWMARAARLLGENYHALPTGSTVEARGRKSRHDGKSRHDRKSRHDWRSWGKDGAVAQGGLVEYTFRTPRANGRGWFAGKRVNRMGGLASGEPDTPLPGSEAAFVTQRYWSFTRRGNASTLVMRTEHPHWRVQPVEQPYLLCDVWDNYGEQFVPYLHHRPRSALLAEGSAITLLLGYEDVGKQAR